MPKPDPTEDIVILYGILSGKTVLRPGVLSCDAEVVQGLTNSDLTAAIMEEGFSKAGLAVISKGEHLVILLPKAETNLLMAELARLGNPPLGTNAFQGEISFQGVELNAFLHIYSRLRQRTVIYPANLSSPPIRLRTQTGLTKEEVCYAMDVILILSGVVAVDDGDKIVQVVSRSQRPTVRTRAPVPRPGAGLIDPKSAPPSTFESYASRLAQFYSELTGCAYIQTNNLGAVPVPFAARVPMTTNEMFYAIETAFALNHLAIVRGENNSISLVRTD